MQLNCEQVKHAYRITTGFFLPDEDAEKIAQMLRSREELLAALVLRDGIFDRWPEVLEQLRAVALQCYAAPSSPRKETENLVVKDQLKSNTASALEQLIASERARSAVADEVHDALQQESLSWIDRTTHPGYHLGVAHEPRD